MHQSRHAVIFRRIRIRPRFAISTFAISVYPLLAAAQDKAVTPSSLRHIRIRPRFAISTFAISVYPYLYRPTSKPSIATHHSPHSDSPPPFNQHFRNFGMSDFHAARIKAVTAVIIRRIQIRPCRLTSFLQLRHVHSICSHHQTRPMPSSSAASGFAPPSNNTFATSACPSSASIYLKAVHCRHHPPYPDSPLLSN